MSGDGGFLAWFGQAVVVGAGWLVVHKLSVARDLDKARREMVAKSADGLISTLTEVLTDSKKYHLGSRCIPDEMRIKMLLQDAAMQAGVLSDVCANAAPLAQCRNDLAALRRAVTGTHFEDEHIAPLTESDPQLQAIAESVLRAKRSFLRLKHLQFKPTALPDAG